MRQRPILTTEFKASQTPPSRLVEFFRQDFDFYRNLTLNLNYYNQLKIDIIASDKEPFKTNPEVIIIYLKSHCYMKRTKSIMGFNSKLEIYLRVPT